MSTTIPDEVQEIAGLIDQLSYRNMRFLSSSLCVAIGEESVVGTEKVAEALAEWAADLMEAAEEEKSSN